MVGLYRGLNRLPAMVSPWYDNGDINHYLKARWHDSNIEELRIQLVSTSKTIERKASSRTSKSLDVMTGLHYREDAL